MHGDASLKVSLWQLAGLFAGCTGRVPSVYRHSANCDSGVGALAAWVRSVAMDVALLFVHS